MIGVYQIELNGKRYIGSTTIGFKKRWGVHLNDLRKGIHHNKHLQYAYNKYSDMPCVFSILEIAKTPEDILALEQYYIDKIKPEYNIRKIADNNQGLEHTIEVKQKISNSHKGRIFTEETRLRMSEAAKHRIVTQETRQKHREAMKGNQHLLGHSPSIETRKKISAAGMGRKYPGRKLSEETKQKISLASKKSWQNATEDKKLMMKSGHKMRWSGKGAVNENNLIHNRGNEGSDCDNIVPDLIKLNFERSLS